MKATTMAFQKRYSDDSGVEFGVTLKDGEIEFEHIGAVSFPVGELAWLIAVLHRIEDELSPEQVDSFGL
jgi:hypothetical protein